MHFLIVSWLAVLQVTKEVFKAAGGRLKVVGRAGVGVDNVDLASATDLFLSLSHSPPYPSLCACQRCSL